jgi:L-ribulose-5-phosphate 3-epimerase
MITPVCLNSNTYAGFDLDDAIVGAERSGIRLIELSAVDGCQHVPPVLSDREADALLRRLHDSGLTPIALGGSANLTTANGRALFRSNLELGAQLGVDYVVTGRGERHGDHSRIGDPATFAAEVAALAHHASMLGVRMAIETHGGNYATGAQVAGLLAGVASDNLFINYDTANVIFYADTDPYDDLEGCLDLVIGIHLKDKAGRRNEWDFPAIGDGETDFARIAGILAGSARTDRVPLSIEIEFTPAGPGSLEAVNSAVLKSVATIESLWR